MEATRQHRQTERQDAGQKVGIARSSDAERVRAFERGRDDDQRDGERDGGEQGAAIEEPGKILRLGSMIKQLLEEVRAAPLDEPSRNRLREIHASAVAELEKGLSTELREELSRIALPLSTQVTPSDAELRIAHAQLVGWLEGMFHGIQAALFAQQMAARAQLEQIRRDRFPGMVGAPMPPGMIGPPMSPGMRAGAQQAPEGAHGTGQYL